MNIAIVDPANSAGYLSKELRKEGIIPFAIYYCDGNLPVEEKMKIASPDLFEKSFKLDRNNKSDIISELKKLDIKAVINGSDFDSVAIADMLNKELETGFGNYDTAACLRNNKYIVNEFIKSAGLPAIDQLLIDRPKISENEKKIIKEWGEVYIKPVYASATFGGKSCSSVEAVEAHLKANFGIKYEWSGIISEFLIQKKITGDEYIVDTVSRRGKHIIIGIYKYHKTYFNDAPIYRSCSTIDIKSKTASILIDYCLKVLDAVGYIDGLCHTEIFIVNNESPLLVEINPRISGQSGFHNKQGGIVFNRTQPSYLALSLKEPSAFAKGKKIPLENKGFALSYCVQSFEKRFLCRFKTEMLKVLLTFTGDVYVLKGNCYVGNPGNLFDTIAYVLLAGSAEDVLSDVKKLEEMEKDGSLFE